MKDGAQESAAGSQTAADARPASATEAPSRREVKSAYETWREEARQTTPQATAAGEERAERGASPAASITEEPARRTEASKASAGEAVASPFATAAARHEGVDEGVGGPNVAAAAEGRGAGVVSEAARRRRAGAVVKENIMPRVGRMRDEALVVLEETPDDAGLRFVAVAVVVFLLFLLLLFLSTVLK
jgi:hypothetical protein